MRSRPTTTTVAAVLWLLLALPAASQDVESEDLAEPSAASEPAAREESARSGLEAEAEAQYLQGNLDVAASLYERLARTLEEPDLAMRHRVLAAWLRQELGESLRAKELLLEGLRAHPSYELPAEQYPQTFVELFRATEAEIERERLDRAAELVRRGARSLHAGSLDEAREHLDGALAIAPEHPVALYNRGLVDLQTENDQAAIDTFERLAALDIRDDSTLSDPLRARVESSLGLLYLRRDYLEDSRTHLRTSVELDPTQESSWTNLGLALRGLGEEAAAEEAFRRAAEIAPESTRALSNLATSHLRLGRPGEAARILREIVGPGEEDPGLWLNLGLAEKELGNLDAARDAFQRSLELDPGGGARGLVTYLALVEFERGDYAASEEAARRAVEHDPSDIEGWTYLGLSRQRQGKIVAARHAFLEAVELAPDRPRSQNNLGTTLVALGDYEGAATAFRKAVEIDPDFAAARENLRQVETALASTRAAREEETRSRRRTKDLGVRFELADFDYLGVGGAVVESVKPRSPAARGGIREGDVIVGVDGQKIDGADDFARYVTAEAPGDTIQIDVLRNERPTRLVIEIR